MRIETGSGRLKISDNPYPMWAFDLVFVLSGVTALTVSLRDTSNSTATIFGIVIGIGNIAAALWMMEREPASVVELDRGSDLVSIRRWGLLGRAASSYPLHELLGASVETTEHTDGGPVYRPRLRFLNGESVPISMFWAQKPNASRDVVDSVKRFTESS